MWLWATYSNMAYRFKCSLRGVLIASFIYGLSDLLRGKKISALKYAAQSLFTVRSARQLLTDPVREGYLHKVSELVRMLQEHFDVLYGGLVDNFVNMRKGIPIQCHLWN